VLVIGIHTTPSPCTATSLNDVSLLDVFPLVELLVLVLLGGYLDHIGLKPVVSNSARDSDDPVLEIHSTTPVWPGAELRNAKGVGPPGGETRPGAGHQIPPDSQAHTRPNWSDSGGERRRRPPLALRPSRDPRPPAATQRTLRGPGSGDRAHNLSRLFVRVK
jgi:hypothetical protein